MKTTSHRFVLYQLKPYSELCTHLTVAEEKLLFTAHCTTQCCTFSNWNKPWLPL